MKTNLNVQGMRLAAAIAASAGFAVSALATPTYTTIALSGVSNQYGPGNGAATFTGASIGTATINNNGQVGFRATSGGNEGFWLFNGAANSNLMIGGGARPGGGTYPTGTSVLGQAAITGSGDYVLRQGAAAGIFTSQNGVGNRVALGGDTAPGGGGALWATSAVANGSPVYNASGALAFVGNLAANASSTPPVVISGAAANAAAFFTGTTGGAPAMVLRQNDTSTLLDAGQTAGESRIGGLAGSYSINGGGSYLITTALQGANIITTSGNAGQNNTVVLTNRNGSLEVIARAGAVAPDTTGAPSSELFRGTSSVGMTSGTMGFNNAGRVSFVGGLRNAAGATTAASALFTDNGGTLRLVARNSTALPTIYRTDGSVNTSLATETWAGFTASTVINAQNTVGFVGQGFSSVANILITMDTAGRMTSIAQTGQTAIVDGAPLGGDAFFSSFSSLQMNSGGQMVFTATLQNTNGVFGGPGGNNSTIFGWDPTLGLQLIARTGDQFTVAPGDVRTISAFNAHGFSGGQDGRMVSLNDGGVYTFSLLFTDGTSGVFTTSIPMPGAAALLGLASLGASRRRRA